MTAIHPHDSQSGFGPLLRSWRQTRRLSQLDLALACGASQRHVSFMESGRARPSRGMALTLGSVLRVPLKDQNLMLLAAGHAPAFAERERTAAPRKAIDAALLEVIRRQDPLPAIILESGTTIVAANRGAERLIAFLCDGPAPTGDLGKLFFSEGGIARFLENADEVAAWADRQARAQRILNLGRGEQIVAPASQPRRDGSVSDAALNLRFAKDGVRLQLYTLLATLGTPLDIGVERLGLEFFLPADEATEDWFRNAA
jgi:transcriptional regulator with XRE-family HTH domain